MASSDLSKKLKPGSWPPPPESKPMPPSSWAKRTGFRPKFSEETNTSDSGQIRPAHKHRHSNSAVDIEAGRARIIPPGNRDPAAEEKQKEKEQAMKRRRDSDGRRGALPRVANGNGQVAQTGRRAAGRSNEGVEVLPQTVEEDGFVGGQSHMKYELRDTPGLGQSSLLKFLSLILNLEKGDLLVIIRIVTYSMEEGKKKRRVFLMCMLASMPCSLRIFSWVCNLQV